MQVSFSSFCHSAWECGVSFLSSTTEKVKRVVKFPEYREGPSPFYKNPWKIFAFGNLSMVIGHVLDIVEYSHHFATLPPSMFGNFASILASLGAGFINQCGGRYSDDPQIRHINCAILTNIVGGLAIVVIDGAVFSNCPPLWEYRIPWFFLTTAYAVAMVSFVNKENPDLQHLALIETQNIQNLVGAADEESVIGS